MTPPVVRWIRTGGQPQRTDGVYLQGTDRGWTAHAGRPVHLRAPADALEAAIAEADEVFPPAGWTCEERVWRAGVWRVSREDGVWKVWRHIDGRRDNPTRQTFATADRARVWASPRVDRGAGPLRGPKPLGGVRADQKLPDVRATPDQQRQVEEILARLDLHYSEFVRAAFAWADAHLERPGAEAWHVERSDGIVTLRPGTRPHER